MNTGECNELNKQRCATFIDRQMTILLVRKKRICTENTLWYTIYLLDRPKDTNAKKNLQVYQPKKQ
jgi:hypothetical protein